MAENENIETPEVKSEQIAKEEKESAKKSEAPAKKFDKKPRRRPSGKFGGASKKSATFSDTLADRFGEALSGKLKRGIEDDLKRKIKAAQLDPKVQEASAKFGK